MSMLKKIVFLLFLVMLGVFLPLRVVQDLALAQKAVVPKPQDNLALGEDEVKQLLLLIDADKTGKITKQSWMKFMEAEFDRLDKDKSGVLDTKELAQSRLRVSQFAKAGR
jgi:hypothetical protein